MEHGRIVSVSRNGGLQGDERIDANGLIVAPGFINIHTHSVFPLLMNLKADSYVRQGVTTFVLGACGRSCAPVNDATRDLLLKDIIGYDSRLPIRKLGAKRDLEKAQAKLAART